MTGLPARAAANFGAGSPLPPRPAAPVASSSSAHTTTNLSMFRPTLAVLSKASRAPLTSKGGNKEYYKGEP